MIFVCIEKIVHNVIIVKRTENTLKADQNALLSRGLWVVKIVFFFSEII